MKNLPDIDRMPLGRSILKNCRANASCVNCYVTLSINLPIFHGRNQARDNGAEPEALPRAEQAAPKASPVDTDAAAALAKLLADPSMATLIKNLAKNL